MSFSSTSISSAEQTFFPVKTGFNSSSIAYNSSTFFGLKLGLSSGSIGIGISVGRVFIGAVLYTAPINITITSAQGSYVVASENGYFTIYPYTDGGGTPIQLVMTANNGLYAGSATITPTVPGVFDLLLMSIVGMATKLLNVPILGMISPVHRECIFWHRLPLQ
jgi:hypothetical protein